MAKKTTKKSKKTIRKSTKKINAELSIIMQAGILFIILASVFLVVYVFKNFI